MPIFLYKFSESQYFISCPSLFILSILIIILKSNSSLLSDNITNLKLKGGNMYIGFFNYIFGSNTNYGVAKIRFN